jgi:hypothetical protein
MCESHAALRGLTGSALMSECHTLSAGNAVHDVPGIGRTLAASAVVVSPTAAPVASRTANARFMSPSRRLKMRS